ncbi:Coiled-coil domain-containing protein 146 [Hondaea fermentalgiana]|uniref:Coiled-coil domain-containing protein 146 n=1 Tax=Hondaea fermentalgiana TaxID=2315210 RepID=A0A2R5GJX3_9STRA|nr:Coiled-coil domain-containing protein 146 [Hondaea fermentalgiana]|eukprot:GBG31177.1 Coiled-coil domain-containing protein 146 [Hondaea fermentalgiana]
MASEGGETEELPEVHEVEIVDISNSAAFVLLNDLVSTGKIDQEAADALKVQYELLHKSTLELYHEEKKTLKKAKQLNQDLLAEKIKLEKLSIRKHEDTQSTVALNKECESTAHELSELMGKGTALHVQVVECQSEKDELERQLEFITKENENLVNPVFEENTEKAKNLEQECARQDKALEESKKERETLVKRNEELSNLAEDLAETRIQLKQTLSKIRADPERIRKQADVVETAVVNLGQEVETLQSQIATSDEELMAQEAKKQAITESGKEISRKLDMHRSTLEQRERDVDALRKSLEEEKSAHQDILAQRVQLELVLKDERLSLKHLLTDLAQTKKSYEGVKKALKKSVAQLDNVKATIPQLDANQADLTASRNLYNTENKELTRKLAALQQEIDIFIANYLRQESIEKSKKQEMETAMAQVKACEHQIALWIEEEHKQAKQLSMLSAQRELRTRDASKAAASHKAAVQDLRIKELTVLDLSKRLTETTNKLRQFSTLYDVVKNERNKYVNLIQASSQALAEMKEKIKILENEVEILRNESIAKDKSLTKEHLAHQAAQCQRDTARHDMNKSQAVYQERQTQVEKQIVEIDKLNSIINNMEKSMVRLKKQYEAAVENRNFSGVQLIDRNDELCILYEKANIQEETLKRGEIGLRDQEEAIRLEKIAIAELERSLQTTRKRLPVVPELAEKVLALKRDLAHERSLTEKLCADLETPENADRWRALLGDDPDLEQLQAKLQVLNHRLNGKKEHLLEKELVLEEVSELAEKLRAKASDGKKNTLTLAKKVNTFQSRIKDTTRRMMAIVSELSMYQATAMKLEQEKHDREAELHDAQLRLGRNEPPSEEAEFEWYRVQKRLEERQRRAQEVAELSSAGGDPFAQTDVGPKRSTAQPRPNAYIPNDALGVPKPYGAQAPFKPTPAGSTMRHIRPPKPQHIEI